MQYGNPVESLFPDNDFLDMPYTSGVRIGQVVVSSEWSANINFMSHRRIRDYLSSAFHMNPNFRSQDSFSKDLRSMVGLSEHEADRTTISKMKAQAKGLLKVDIIHIAYSQNEIDAAERFWIYFFKAQDPNYGYNVQRGGKGSARFARPDSQNDALSIMARNDLTYFDIDRVIKESLLQDSYGEGGGKEFAMNSLGLSIVEFNRVVEYLYEDIVREHFPSRTATYSSVRDLYIGNKIITLMRAGFWDRKEIGVHFGLKMMDGAGGTWSGFQTLEKWCRRIFGKTFDQVKMDLLDSIIYPKVRKYHKMGELSYSDIADFIPGMDKDQVRYWMDKIYGYEVPSTTSYRTGSRSTAGFSSLRARVKRDQAIPLLMMDISPKDIATFLGYTSTKDVNYIFKSIFWGLDSESARLLFTGRYLPPRGTNPTLRNKYIPWWEHFQDYMDGFY